MLILGRSAEGDTLIPSRVNRYYTLIPTVVINGQKNEQTNFHCSSKKKKNDNLIQEKNSK